MDPASEDTATNAPTDPPHATERQVPVGTARAVQFVPSGDVIAHDPTPTTTSSDNSADQARPRQSLSIGVVREVQVEPSADEVITRLLVPLFAHATKMPNSCAQITCVQVLPADVRSGHVWVKINVPAVFTAGAVTTRLPPAVEVLATATNTDALAATLSHVAEGICGLMFRGLAKVSIVAPEASAYIPPPTPTIITLSLVSRKDVTPRGGMVPPVELVQLSPIVAPAVANCLEYMNFIPLAALFTA